MTFMVAATVIIGILGFMVWMHHMFTTGSPYGAQFVTMYLTMLIAVPTGIKIFNWMATIYKGSMTFETPMLFALGIFIHVHHRWFFRHDAGAGSCRLSISRFSYFVVATFSLCVSLRFVIYDYCRCLLLVAEMDWSHV